MNQGWISSPSRNFRCLDLEQQSGSSDSGSSQFVHEELVAKVSDNVRHGRHTVGRANRFRMIAKRDDVERVRITTLPEFQLFASSPKLGFGSTRNCCVVFDDLVIYAT
jgi:hypothetical protein